MWSTLSAPKVKAEILQELFRGWPAARFSGRRVTLCIPDATRPLPTPEILSTLLQYLQDCGAQCKVLVALGLHRFLKPTELAPLDQICQQFSVPLLQHDAQGPQAELNPHVGGKEEPLPACFHPAVIEAEVLCCLGLVEPHQYAGFSGGIKTISIGCAGVRTISSMHSLSFLRSPNSRLGQIDQNPFQEALWRLRRTLKKPCFLFQCCREDDSLRFFAGLDQQAFYRAYSFAGKEAFEDHHESLDWAHLIVPNAKAQSFYQASRAASYVSLVEPSVVKEGGTLLLEASCPEGIGQGAGELAFAHTLERGLKVHQDELIEGPGPEGFSGGAQRAYVLAQVLKKHRLVVIGTRPMPLLRAWNVTFFDSFREAQNTLELGTQGRSFTDVFRRLPRLVSSPENTL